MRKIFVLILTATFLAGISFASEFVYVGEGISRTILKNGVRVLLKPDSTVDIVAVHVWVDAGSKDEAETESGISHLVEHMLFRSTKTRPAGRIDEEVESMGGNLNGGTSRDFTNYHITVPGAGLERALDLLSDAVFNPTFDTAELEKERDVVIEECGRKEDSPWGFVWEEFFRQMYGDHPYGPSVLGKVELLKKYERELLIKYHSRHYVPKDIVLIIVGNFDANTVYEKIYRYFSAQIAEESPSERFSDATWQPEKNKTIVRKPVKRGYIMMGFPGAGINDKDVYALDVLGMILGSGETSRLNQNIKEKKNLAEYVGGGSSNYKLAGFFFVQAEFYPEKKEKLESAVYEELKRVKEDGITREELNKAKTMIESAYVFERETYQGQADILGYYETITGAEFSVQYLKNIAGVTLEDVKNCAQKYLDYDKSVTITVLPAEEKK